MVATQALKVVTQFVFEEASVSSLSKLEQRFVGLEQITGNVLANIKGMSSQLLMSLAGAGAGLGILGILQKSVSVAEKFKQSQLDISNLLSTQNKNMTFNNQLIESEKILKRIADISFKFSLDEGAFSSGVKMIAAVLGGKKKFKGDIFDASTDLARNAMKSASVFGVHEGNAQYALRDMLMGRGNNQNTFTSSLFAESKDVFQKHGVSSVGALNSIMKSNPTKGIKILNDAMGKFNSNIEMLEARAESLTGQFQRLKNLFEGYDSILGPLGDVLEKNITPILRKLVMFLKTNGGEVIKRIAEVLDGILESPKKFIASILEMQTVSNNISKASGFTTFAIIAVHIGALFTLLSKFFGFISKYFVKFFSFFGIEIAKTLAPVIKFFQSGVMVILRKSFVFLFFNIARIAFWAIPIIAQTTALFLAFFVIFQGISRALTKFKVEMYEIFLENLPWFMKQLQKLKDAFKDVILPFNIMIEFLDEFVTSLLGLNDASAKSEKIIALVDWFVKKIEGIGNAFKGVAEVMVFAKGTIEHFIISIYTHFSRLSERMSGKGFLRGTWEFLKTAAGFSNDKGVTKKDSEAIWKFVESNNERYLKMLYPELYGQKKLKAKSGPTQNVENQVINMYQDFKGNMSPDRIAFTLTKALKKEAENSLKSAFGDMAVGPMI